MSRLVAIDWMRGIVMVLMAVDHSSQVFNSGRVSPDAALWGAAGADLLPAQFLTRWITHLCAPTFVFLAGTSVALSIQGRQQRGVSERTIDGHLVSRGLLIVAFEVWMWVATQMIVLQVLYAIGAGLVCLVLLRRLPTALLAALSVGWLVLGEAVVTGLGWGATGTPSLPVSLLFVPGVYPLDEAIVIGPWVSSIYRVVVYPLLPWLAIMTLGLCFGRFLAALRSQPDLARRASRWLVAAGASALAVFVVQRLFDGPDGAYGNYWLPRSDESFLRWLQVSKYPPSLAFCALELGLMALILAALFRLQHRHGERASTRSPLRVFGETALFFYLLHLHFLALVGNWGFGAHVNNAPRGLGAAWLFAGVVLIVLYPLCLWFRSVKAARPGSFLRFI